MEAETGNNDYFSQPPTDWFEGMVRSKLTIDKLPILTSFQASSKQGQEMLGKFDPVLKRMLSGQADLLIKYGFEVFERRDRDFVLLWKHKSTSKTPGYTYFTREQREALARGVMIREFPVAKVAHDLDVEHTTLYRYSNNAKAILVSRAAANVPETDLVFSQSSIAGRPSLLDQQAGQEYSEYIYSRGKKENNCVKSTHVEEQLVPFLKGIEATRKRKGLTPFETASNGKSTTTLPKAKTMKKIENLFGINHITKGRTITKARVEAVACPRNAIVHAVSLETLCKGRHPCLIGNCDSTQFMGSGDYDSCELLVVVKEAEQQYEVRTIRDEETVVFVKYFSIYFCNGYAAPPIFIVAREELEPGMFLYEKVPLLHHSMDPVKYGYIVWAKTRVLKNGVNAISTETPSKKKDRKHMTSSKRRNKI